jgi:phage gp36-like protein
MAYCTEDNLRRRLPRGAIDALAAAEGAVTQAQIIADCIDDASAEIDGWIGQRYDVPIADADVTRTIRWLAVTIAGYMILNKSQATSEELENWKSMYIRAVAFLEAVAKGDTSIAGIDEGGEEGDLLIANFDDIEQNFTFDKRSGGRSLAGISNRTARDA